MRTILRNNLAAIIFSVLVHAVLVVLLVLSFDWTAKPELQINKPNVVKAVVVDASKVQAELDKLKRAEDRKKQQEKDRLTRLKQQEQQTKRQRAEEEKRLARLKKEQAELKQKRIAEQKQRKLEQARLQKLKQEQDDLKRKQVAEEKKRQAEQARLAKLKKEQEALKKKQAEEKKQREAEAKQRQQELASQLEAEERAQAEAQATREIDRYMVLIRQKVVRNWLKPPGSSKGLVSKVKVRLIPGGDVIDVKVIKSSGNAVYDRSVERAVRKASPLPLPGDPAIAARMYDIEFNFALET